MPEFYLWDEQQEVGGTAFIFDLQYGKAHFAFVWVWVVNVQKNQNIPLSETQKFLLKKDFTWYTRENSSLSFERENDVTSRAAAII